jgi:hypothetical protein
MRIAGGSRWTRLALSQSLNLEVTFHKVTMNWNAGKDFVDGLSPPSW